MSLTGAGRRTFKTALSSRVLESDAKRKWLPVPWDSVQCGPSIFPRAGMEVMECILALAGFPFTPLEMGG